jgi:hypothetical protein
MSEENPEVIAASDSHESNDDPKLIQEQPERDPVIVEKDVDGEKVQVSAAPGHADDQRVKSDEVDVIEVEDGPGTYEYEKEPNE